MTMKNVGLCSPWINYYKEVNALFAEDPGVKVEFDQESYTIKIYVDEMTGVKAAAIEELFPTERVFGNIVVEIEVIPSDGANEDGDVSDLTRAELFQKAFDGNPAVVMVVDAGPLGYDFVIFKKEVVQYYNDDLTDAYGYRSTLYQTLAEQVFGISDNVFYSTEVPATNTLGAEKEDPCAGCAWKK